MTVHYDAHPPFWQRNASCNYYPPDWWTGDRRGGRGGDPTTARAAVAICQGCPVQTPCLAWALDVEDGAYRHGIFGGLTGPQRMQLTRKGKP